MISQEPMVALDPMFSVAYQLTQPIRRFRGGRPRPRRGDRRRAAAAGRHRDAERVLKSYPHQLSGGMAQRVCIALALTGEPKLLIADEPTTALDVTVQAEILSLLRALVRDTGLSVVIVSHDLGVVADICDDVAVMYAGEVVESGAAAAVLDDPAHPYTMALLGANPHVPEGEPVPVRLASIPGTVPPPGSWPTGCRFATPLPVRRRSSAPVPFAAAARARRRLGAVHPGRRARPRPRHLGRRRVGAEIAAPTARVAATDRWSALMTAPAGATAVARAAAPAPALEVRDLVVRYGSGRKARERRRRPSTASASTSRPARPSALVGESGSGKSTIGKAVLGLQPPTAGTSQLHGQDITSMSLKQRSRLVADLRVVFQDPYSLAQPGPHDRPDPGRAAAADGHQGRRGAGRRPAPGWSPVGLPGDAADRYPTQFSGGQRQRIAIARALVCDPKVVVLDEPVSRAGPLHPGAGAQPARRPARPARPGVPVHRPRPRRRVLLSRSGSLVLYRGQIMETGPVEAITPAPAPLHRGADRRRAGARARPSRPPAGAAREALGVGTAGGRPPAPTGCPFVPRCPLATDVCWTKRPIDAPFEDRTVACHVFDAASGHPQAGGAAALTAGELEPTAG